MFKVKDGLRVGLIPVVDATGNVLTNAATATKLKTPITISIAGDVVGDATTDFASNTTINVVLANTNFTANNATYLNGQPASYYLNWNNFTNKPTTVSGYGITDAVTTSGNQSISGTKTFTDAVVTNATVTNLVVTGTTTTVNSVNLEVSDPIINVGTNNTGSTTYLGIKAERGSQGNDAYVVWNETSDSFQFVTAQDDNMTSAVRVPLLARQINLDMPQGTAPLVVTSNTVVTNLNADLLDGIDGSNYTRSDLTYLGRTGNQTFDAVTNTATAWSALPVGYSRMIGTSIGTAGGAPINTYGYFTKIANRDTAGGWGGLWAGYNAGQNYIGRASDSSTLASWDLLWSSANHGPGSGLNADLLDGQHGAYYQNASNINAGTLSDSYLPSTLSGKTFASTVTISATGSSATGSGQLFLNSGTLNRIDFNAAGLAAPTVNTRSAGTKLLLWNGLTATNTDYAIGIETNAIWSSVPSLSQSFKWYANTTAIATLDGSGGLNLASVVTTGDLRSNLDLRLMRADGTTPAIVVGHNNGFRFVTNASGSSRTITLNVSPSGAFLVNNATVWTNSNHGSGSGLDADLLDGQDGSYYLSAVNLTGTLPDSKLSPNVALVNANTTVSGWYTFSKPIVNNNDITADGGNFVVQTTTNTSATSYAYQVKRNGTSVGGIAVDGKGVFTVGTTIDGQTAWHAGNDGAGSTLDADLLDGLQGWQYARADVANPVLGNGVTNQNIILNLGSGTGPGIGYTSGINFNRQSDGAGLNVTEIGSDSTLYEFWMSDNPDAGDYYSWRFTDWQSSNGLWQPLYIGGLTTRIQSKDLSLYSPISQRQSAYFTTSDSQNVVTSARNIVYIDNTNKLKVSGSGTLSMTLNVSGYTGGSGNVVFIRLTGTGTTFEWGYGSTGSTVQETGLAVTTGGVTLNNGVVVGFATTTGGVAGDIYAFRAWSKPTNNLSQTSINGTFSTQSGSSGVATIYAQGSGFTGGDVLFIKSDSSNQSNNFIKLQANISGSADTFAYFRYDGNSTLNIVTPASTIKINSNAVWHTGNQGPGSGLNSDLLDGQHGAYYLDWGNLTNKPTTISGYGITDAASLSASQTFTGTNTFGSNVIVNSNFTTNGTVILNGSNLEIADEVITLARNSAGSAPYVGFKVERGTTDAFLVWDESIDRFVAYTSNDDLSSKSSVPFQGSYFVSTTATGTAPMVVSSNTVVSNFNADLLDGYQATDFARQAATNTFSALQYFRAAGSSSNADFISLAPTDYGVGKPALVFRKSSTASEWQMMLNDGSSNNGTIKIVSSNLLMNSNVIWHAGNDGDGSGLDSDLLDGQHGSYYAPISSPALVGSPTAPTIANASDNTTAVATTAFVQQAINQWPSNTAGFDVGPWDPGDAYLFAQKALDEMITGNWSFTGNVAISNLQVANTNITNTQMGVSPPPNAKTGDVWVDLNTGIEYTYVDDGDTQQWVELGPSNIQGSSSVPMIISDTDPALSGQYFWIQTLPDGGMTFWVNT